MINATLILIILFAAPKDTYPLWVFALDGVSVGLHMFEIIMGD